MSTVSSTNSILLQQLHLDISDIELQYLGPATYYGTNTAIADMRKEADQKLIKPYTDIVSSILLFIHR
jgi:hypothetical protein